MKITIDKSLDLALSPDLAWAMLNDIEGVTACLPGAKITETIDETHFKGTVSVKLGPATVSFKGNIEIAERDAKARSLHIIGTGSDMGGTSGASLDLHAVVEATDGGSRLSGKSDVTVTGKVATFGARLMNSVSDVLLQKFFANLAMRAEALQAAQPLVATAATENVMSLPAAPAAPAAETNLNALALAWAVIKDFLANLFRRTKAT
ncbi:SRPBCC family protein [Acidisoma cellulosilytica]|uniref:SRPBCC family protein n=1 Tax=Acidisoma cellulosilyticum TaxID=2802395 RepID=A0A963Z5C2_9PROT|nr:SRPBCC family protein [Acidisoma cellulosilyticum]MCB8883129.1 SRPBCC family protein [Acidisoma cellulosilyticum]